MPDLIMAGGSCAGWVGNGWFPPGSPGGGHRSSSGWMSYWCRPYTNIVVMGGMWGGVFLGGRARVFLGVRLHGRPRGVFGGPVAQCL